VIKAIESAKDGEEIEIEVASGGGDVYAGSEIYTALKEYKGNIVAKIVGMAGSAASVIVMAAKTIKMSPTAQMMIHKTSVGAYGNEKDHTKMAEVLQSHDIAIANAYMLKTGMTQEQVLELMDKETYFNAKTALENKLIDEVMFDEELKLTASVESLSFNDQFIEKMRSFIASQKEIENRVDDPEPVSNIEQIKEFARIKNKIYGGLL
jgi:ATP-dependent protease ClpP protease subunit